MPARVIPFPQPASSLAQSTTSPRETPAYGAAFGAQKIHLVPEPLRIVEADPTSQQLAQRIVSEIRRMHKGQETVTEPAVLTERSPQFWATLPLPESCRETPLSVARRLVHLLIAHPA